jgi:hypothetical protein
VNAVATLHVALERQLRAPRGVPLRKMRDCEGAGTSPINHLLIDGILDVYKHSRVEPHQVRHGH